MTCEPPAGSHCRRRIRRRWVVERTFGWLNRNRRLAKDFEASIESAIAWLMIASVKLLTRRIQCDLLFRERADLLSQGHNIAEQSGVSS
jgi:hypothetical protein